MSKFETQMSFAIADILTAVENYSQAYSAEFGDKVGGDAILGDEGIREILRGARVLLNGPLGRSDGGTFDHRILQIAKNNNLLDENGEL